MSTAAPPLSKKCTALALLSSFLLPAASPSPLKISKVTIRTMVLIIARMSISHDKISWYPRWHPLNFKREIIESILHKEMLSLWDPGVIHATNVPNAALSKACPSVKFFQKVCPRAIRLENHS
jgi:hypothetical protein